MIIGISGIAGSGKDTLADFLVKENSFVKVALADPLKRIAKEVYEFTDDQLWGPSASRNAPDTRYPRPCSLCAEHGSIDGRGPCPLCAGTKTTYLTAREALQTLGTEWGRHRYGNTWVDYAMRRAKKLLPGNRAGHHTYNARDGLQACSCQSDDRHSTHGGRTPWAGGVAIPDVRFRNELNAIREGGGKVIRVMRPGAGLKGAAGAHVSETEQTSIQDDEFDHVILNHGSLDDLAALVRDMMQMSTFKRGV